MGAILMMSAKLITLGVLKRKILLNKIDNVCVMSPIKFYHVAQIIL